MKTIGDLVKTTQPRRLVEDLLAHVLGLKRIELYMQFDRPLIELELEQLRALWKRAVRGEPVQYVMGEVEFLGCRLKVDRRALIPRQETEILADYVAKLAPEGTLWDICCGSGCLGIALKKKFPSLNVVLSDISAEALELARENAERNEVDVTFLQGDLLAPFHNLQANFVVCNPPYISQSSYDQLDPSVRNFEPKGALVGGERGTEFYERLAAELPPFLAPHARVCLEIGFDQGDALKKNFNWGSQTLQKDWSGKDRFFFLEKQ